MWWEGVVVSESTAPRQGCGRMSQKQRAMPSEESGESAGWIKDDLCCGFWTSKVAFSWPPPNDFGIAQIVLFVAARILLYLKGVANGSFQFYVPLGTSPRLRRKNGRHLGLSFVTIPLQYTTMSKRNPYSAAIH
ncbi:uncharacterized protein SPSK_06733 [Sporothrix schenckii 1099-18]|uniref:Uncharacterized protein n=1 Tax=Sporothrix schenckii 1099-18 TaxID=1397361 RepID=A0A0F2MIE2_SPOSC|nr:uncharacterized protein SPSK_06733 [Sporothrix schenckii 1099-18]KJR89412.1 hypothetical protein SPSK_06733 [Sporothrix schenckii 1099-18]